MIREEKLPVGKRLYSIDILRIIAMLFIVVNHYLGHCVALAGFSIHDPHVFYDWYIRGVCYTGTNLFILITAFFLSRSTFKIKHVLSLACQVWFYSIVIYLLANLTGSCSFSGIRLLQAATPIINSHYWFITCYIALYFLAPFLNILINSLSRNGLRRLLIVLFICFSFVPSFVFWGNWLGWGGSSGIVWFVVLYLTGAYIRKYIDINYLIRVRQRLLICTLLLSLLPLLSKVIIAFITSKTLGYIEGSSLLYVKNSILIFPMSISIFLLFLTFDITNKAVIRVVSFITTGVFAVYLITENSYVRDWLWSNMSQIIIRNSPWYFLIQLSSIIALYGSCVLFDRIRRILFDLVSKTGLPNKMLSFFEPRIDPIFKALNND